jgi:drug/metabolite transporter (DMT)-like permease
MYNDNPATGNSVTGVLLMFLAVFAGVGYSVVVKKMSGKYNPFTIVTYQNAIGTLFFIPFIMAWEWQDLVALKFSLDMLYPLMKLAVFASTIAFLLFTISIKQLGISKSAVFTNSIPVFTAVFAFIVLKEDMGGLKILGITIVIFGLLLSQINRLKTRKISK